MTTDPLNFRALRYGAVYFRKSNPPRLDWERDHAVAAEDGYTTFRHWFMWSAIQPGPEAWDWSDYDRQLELAEQNGLGVIIAELTKTAPEWVFRRLAHARYQRRDGQAVESGMFDSSAVGGNPGVCLDNEDAKDLAGEFLTRLASRYRGHPALVGYDVWNECNYEADVCFGDATAKKFRQWLVAKYSGAAELGTAWGRYVESFDDIVPPRGGYAYGDVLDWLEFRRDNAYDLMRWRVETIRSVDPDHAIIAHGVAGSLGLAASRGADDWQAAANADIYGMAFIPARHGDESWRQALALDLTRSASRGKPFWHAELQGGPLWLQPQVLGRPREDGRIPHPSDIRYWNLASFAHGACGLFYLRWRPLLNGPLFGAFAPYGMDGERTERSAMVPEMAAWLRDPAREELWELRPRRGDLGILVVPESQDLAYAQHSAVVTGAGPTSQWVESVEYHDAAAGCWRAFFDSGVRVDFVHVSDLVSTDHKLLYLPYPLMLKDETVDALRAWVEAGGQLISEAAPGYFGDNGWAAPRQPGRGLAEVFGVSELDIEFVPDLLRATAMSTPAGPLCAGGNRQWYEPSNGVTLGTHDDGRPALVENCFGQGRTLLVGSHPGIGYLRNPAEESRHAFAWMLEWAGIAPQVTVSDPAITVRLHDGPAGSAVWALNPTDTERRVVIGFTAGGHGEPDLRGATLHTHRGDASAVRSVGEDRLELVVPARDAVVLTVTLA